jgi:hypothetical protein
VGSSAFASTSTVGFGVRAQQSDVACGYYRACYCIDSNAMGTSGLRSAYSAALYALPCAIDIDMSTA